jgi:hypothetical protein
MIHMRNTSDRPARRKWKLMLYRSATCPLYVAGWNENRNRAHRGGILRFVTRNLDPGAPGLMARNLRRVTSTGIGYLLETVAVNIRKAITVHELTFSAGGEETVYCRKTRVLKRFSQRKG